MSWPLAVVIVAVIIFLLRVFERWAVSWPLAVVIVAVIIFLLRVFEKMTEPFEFSGKEEEQAFWRFMEIEDEKKRLKNRKKYGA